MNYPHKYAVLANCVMCQTRTDYGKRINKKFVCADCLIGCCEECGIELTDDKLPSQNNQKLFICVSCHKSQLTKERDRIIDNLNVEISRVFEKFQFQIDFQYCVRCGSFNTSRNDNYVEYRFCEKCRQFHGDMNALERSRRADRDNRKLKFDKVIGVCE